MYIITMSTIEDSRLWGFIVTEDGYNGYETIEDAAKEILKGKGIEKESDIIYINKEKGLVFEIKEIKVKNIKGGK